MEEYRRIKSFISVGPYGTVYNGFDTIRAASYNITIHENGKVIFTTFNNQTVGTIGSINYSLPVSTDDVLLDFAAKHREAGRYYLPFTVTHDGDNIIFSKNKNIKGGFGYLEYLNVNIKETHVCSVHDAYEESLRF